MNNMNKELGAVYTPPDVANLLVDWAILNPTDQILDLGIGEGAFVFASFRKLMGLGASQTQSTSQIYGTEIDKTTFIKFKGLAAESNLDFPHVTCQDFFQASFPQVDTIVGNPPYVRRRGFPIDQLDIIRRAVTEANPEIEENKLSRLTDVYVYFLLHAIKYLKPGGRLAVVVADSWLNARYGRFLKSYLKQHFEIERFINFDRPLFENAQVKPVLIFATKKTNKISQVNPKLIPFSRVMNGLPVTALSELISSPELKLADVNTNFISSNDLDDNQPWGIHFKISEISERLAASNSFVPLKDIAHTRIGIQTLAKKFFALTPEQIQNKGLKSQFLKPFAHSIAQFNTRVIEENVTPNLYIFYCSQSKDELNGTKALVHIQCGEQEILQVRGKKEVIIGYQNKERIIKANRPNWYDIKTDVERRGCAPILIPRIISHRYVVLWNKAGYVPGGTIIELLPHISLQSEESDNLLLLAIMNSTLMEVLIRGHAQMYGGGASTVSLSQIKSLLFPDVRQFTIEQQNELITAYKIFLEMGSRKIIDETIWNILGLDKNLFYSTAEDLRMLAVRAKKHA